MSWLRKLLGGSRGERRGLRVEHEGYVIVATPVAEGGQFRVCAEISREIDGEVKTHTLVRADVLQSREAAEQLAIVKARQVIAERGEGLF